MPPRRVSILGSTGSIGCNALQVVGRFPRDLVVAALAAKRNVQRLAEQIIAYKPEAAAVYDAAAAAKLKSLLPRSCRTQILHGDGGYAAVAAWDGADVTLSAMVGAAGLRPTLAAIDAGKTIALANKETLVMAGALVTGRAAERGVRILPVDSEHSAVFQCLEGGRRENVDHILLTASGGPFRDRPAADFARITPADALRHPNWSMGAKITIDSATLMNKGLEVIEATWLFGLPQERIRVVVHPQSIVHSMVAFHDGVVLAQLGMPDMKPA
ncbi:MAG TPA: 1-deoxy-D-xylulose-5-phosphate reductoisomerase, partial [Steroidobacteraceae bacterium]|nr:1-deoxy-D-xylulose-5-phosphate reductoisomerase [Steroidobacteraceae bacterium]